MILKFIFFDTNTFLKKLVDQICFKTLFCSVCNYSLVGVEVPFNSVYPQTVHSTPNAGSKPAMEKSSTRKFLQHALSRSAYNRSLYFNYFYSS